jgi:type IV pilus assembly protein PilB
MLTFEQEHLEFKKHRHTFRKESVSTNLPSKKEDLSGRQLLRVATDEALALIPRELVEKHQILPLFVRKNKDQVQTLYLAVTEHISLEALQEIRFVSGCELEIEMLAAEIIRAAVSRMQMVQQKELTAFVQKAEQILPEKQNKFFGNTIEQTNVSELEIPKLLHSILLRAIELEASDLHCEYLLKDSTKVLSLRFRIHGTLMNEEYEISEELFQALSRRLKILCDLDPCGPPMIREGGCSFEKKYRLRVSFVPQKMSERIVIRFFGNDPLSLDTFFSLGVLPEQEKILRRTLALHHGTILSVGPTGSGKSTFLYRCLQEISSNEKLILTLEDPIERVIPGVSQFEIIREREFTFEKALPALLRQDPDAILIGEIRTEETGRIALSAGITGHAVFSTLHAGNALEALVRLRQLGIDEELIQLSLTLIIGQRLLRLSCPDCREEVLFTKEQARIFQIQASDSVVNNLGCEECHYTGAVGRIGVFEFLDVKSGILQSRTHEEFKERAKEIGYLPMEVVIREYLRMGKISVKEAGRALGI